jgi:hypothetical protein
MKFGEESEQAHEAAFKEEGEAAAKLAGPL